VCGFSGGVLGWRSEVWLGVVCCGLRMLGWRYWLDCSKGVWMGKGICMQGGHDVKDAVHNGFVCALVEPIIRFSLLVFVVDLTCETVIAAVIVVYQQCYRRFMSH